MIAPYPPVLNTSNQEADQDFKRIFKLLQQKHLGTPDNYLPGYVTEEEMGHQWLNNKVFLGTMQLTCQSNERLTDYGISKQRTQSSGFVGHRLALMSHSYSRRAAQKLFPFNPS